MWLILLQGWISRGISISPLPKKHWLLTNISLPVSCWWIVDWQGLWCSRFNSWWMLQGVAPVMETFDNQSGSCLIVWPRQKLTGWQQHTVRCFHRLRRVERITNKRHSLSSHYKLQEKTGGEAGKEWGGGGKQNQGILLHITKVCARQFSRLMRWDRANTNEYQPLPNLFCLQMGTICDCMLIIILYCPHLFGHLLHVPHWKRRQAQLIISHWWWYFIIPCRHWESRERNLILHDLNDAIFMANKSC